MGLGALLIFIGVARLAPAVARPMSSVIGRPLARLLGMSGRLGRENSMRSPRRTAQTASALMVGLALVSVIAVFGASLSQSATASIDQAIAANIIVSNSNNNGPGAFSTTVPAAVAGVPGVTSTSTVYGGQFEFRQSIVSLRGDHDQEPVADPDPDHGLGHAAGLDRRESADRHVDGQLRPPLRG